MKKVNEVYKVLKDLKIKENFIIIHSDIVGLEFQDFSLSKLWEAIYHAIGSNKTYLLPAFSFSENNKWSYKKTPSEAGALSEYFRKKISIKRTIHPIHSISIFGKNYRDIPDHNCSSSFGKGSVWEWLCNRKDVCNLSLGVKLNGGATICHYPEEYIGVNYRYYIPIKKIIIGKNKNKIKKKYNYFARIKNKNSEGHNNWNRCEKDLLDAKILLRKYVFKNKYPISIMNTYKASQFLIKKLKKNPNYIGKLFKKKLSSY